jgi:hypothetical protein
MFSPEMQYLVNQEQRNDLLADVERQQLIRMAESRHEVVVQPVHKLMNWLGARLVHWGAQLQNYGTVSAPPAKISHS